MKPQKAISALFALSLSASGIEINNRPKAIVPDPPAEAIDDKKLIPTQTMTPEMEKYLSPAFRSIEKQPPADPYADREDEFTAEIKSALTGAIVGAIEHTIKNQAQYLLEQGADIDLVDVAKQKKDIVAKIKENAKWHKLKINEFTHPMMHFFATYVNNNSIHAIIGQKQAKPFADVVMNQKFKLYITLPAQVKRDTFDKLALDLNQLFEEIEKQLQAGRDLGIESNTPIAILPDSETGHYIVKSQKAMEAEKEQALQQRMANTINHQLETHELTGPQ